MANVTGYTKAGVDKLVAPLFSSISPFTVGGHYYSPVTYFWPDFYNEGQAGKVSKWAKTLAYGNALGYVIMNRSTGDWSAKDNDFLAQAQRASAAGAKRILWYIPTRYGVASLGKDDAARNGVPDPDKFTREYIMQLCANLRSQYGDLFQGVFLDEVINGWGAQSGRVGWYGDLIGEIRRTYGKNFTIAINPGSNITEAVCALDFDVCMSFENTAAKYLTDDPNNPIANDVMRAQPSTKWWHVIHGVTKENFRQVIDRAASFGVSHLYVTDGELVQGEGGQWVPEKNPYQNPPSDWIMERVVAWHGGYLGLAERVAALEAKAAPSPQPGA